MHPSTALHHRFVECCVPVPFSLLHRKTQADEEDDGLLTFSRPMVAADGSVLMQSPPSMSGSGSLPGGVGHAAADGAAAR